MKTMTPAQTIQTSISQYERQESYIQGEIMELNSTVLRLYDDLCSAKEAITEHKKALARLTKKKFVKAITTGEVK
jgi:hypothetical protein